MIEYTPLQIGLMQKFVDLYRAAPEILQWSDRFVGMDWTAEEKSGLVSLIALNLVDKRADGIPGHPLYSEFYRLADSARPEVVRLKQEGKIVFN